MELTKILQKHIEDISVYQGADLHREIDSFVSQNQGLSESELFNEIHSRYGRQINFLENAAQSKAIINIRGWVALFGFFFLLGIVILIICSILLLTYR